MNENGISKLYLMELDSRQLRAIPGLPNAVVGGLYWHANRGDLGFSLNNARAPTDVYSFNIDRNALTRWTESETGGLNTKDFPDAQLVKWKTFDGKEITGFLYMPPPRFTGKRAVIVNVHGGPRASRAQSFSVGARIS